MRNQEVVAVCVNEIVAKDHVTFVELINMMEGCGVETKGGLAITLGGRPNTLLWAGMSEDAVEIIYDIMKQTDQAPASYMTYLIDGGVLTFPLVKSFRKKDYTKEHWLPLCFRPKGSVKR